MYMFSTFAIVVLGYVQGVEIDKVKRRSQIAHLHMGWAATIGYLQPQTYFLHLHTSRHNYLNHISSSTIEWSIVKLLMHKND